MVSIAEKLLLLLDGGAFSPAGIDNLVAWYDASDTSTLFQDSAGTTPATDTDVVGRWNDKSVNGYHLTQNTTANKPVVDSAGVRGDGTDDYLSNASVSATGNWCIVWVGDIPTRDTDTYLFDNVGSGRSAIYSGGTSNRIVTFTGTGGSLTTSNGALDGTRTLWFLTFNGSESSIRKNGAEITTGTDGADNLVGLKLLVNKSNVQASDCRFNEIVIYNRALTPDEIASIETYLNDKWSVY